MDFGRHKTTQYLGEFTVSRKAASAVAVLAITALSVFGLATPAAAATVTVCATGCDATTIQAAVNAANPGDTITVAAGTYTEVVSINKADLVLQGARAGVDARGRTGAETIIFQGQLQLAANGITIDGFSFTDARSAIAAPVAAIAGSGRTGTQILNNIIENSMFGAQFNNVGPSQARVAQNVFNTNNANLGGGGGTGVIMFGGGSTNVLITENNFSGHLNAAINVIGTNIQITNNHADGDATLAVVTSSSNVVIDGNALVDGVGGSGIFLGLGNAGITVSNNQIDSDSTVGDNLAAIRISDAFGGPGASSNVTITGNETTGGWAHAIRRTAGALDGALPVHDNSFWMVVTNEDTNPANVIDATSNWWAPGIDLSTMANVDAESPCANVGCATPAILPPTGPEKTVAGAIAASVLAAGFMLMVVAGRRRGARAS